MKSIINKIGIMSLMLMLLFPLACRDSFLDIPAAGSLEVNNNKTQLSSRAGLEGVVIAAYSQLNGRGGYYTGFSNWLWGSIRGGEANKGTDAGDQSVANSIQRYEALATSGSVNEKYRFLYEGVARCNSAISLIKVSTESDSYKNPLLAQVYFLRGLYYFELKRNFNNTPFVDETNFFDKTKYLQIVPNDKDLYLFIEKDFQAAIKDLPETQGDVGRVNKSAAKAFLAKVYLYQKKYKEAKELFDDIIANGKTSNGKKYGLVPKYADIFKASNDNHEESVFAIQSSVNTGSDLNANPDLVLNFPYGGGPGGCCGFFQPSFELGNSFRTKNGLPLLDFSYNVGENQLKTDMGILSKDPFVLDTGPVDPRLDHSIGRRGIPYLDWGKHPGQDWIRLQTNGGPYAPKKYIYYKAEEGKLTDNSSWTNGYTAINIYIMRYADVLLMAAECEVAGGGSKDKARGYVNMIRKRAANSDGFVKDDKDATKNAANYVINEYPAAGWDAIAETAVRFERKFELSGEGHGFYDLVRWGIADLYLNAYIAYESAAARLNPALGGSVFDKGKDELLPIPQSEIDLVGRDKLKQNPGY